MGQTDPNLGSAYLNLNISSNEEAERDAKSRFGILCERLPVGLLIVDQSGTIQLSNRKTTAMFGASSQDLVGRNLLTLVCNPPTESFPEFLNDVKNRGWVIELDARSDKSESFPIELSLTEFPIADNALLLATIMDITERRQFQRLRQELIAMVSHDLATPLASIQLALEFIGSKTSEQVTDGDLQLAKKAEKSVGHLIKLVDDLLTVERLESGKIDLFLERFEVRNLLQDSADLLEDFAASKQVTIRVQNTDLQMVADQDRLKQVVMNFLSNAVKFSAANGVIDLFASSTEDNVRITVADQGRGVPRTEQKLIFERFHQVERNDAIQQGGRGLGLAICKALIEGHGGEIGVISESGKGSSFWFTIPHVKDVPASPSNSSTSER